MRRRGDAQKRRALVLFMFMCVFSSSAFVFGLKTRTSEEEKEAHRESGLRNEVFATFSNSTSDIHSSRCVFEGFSNTYTLQWTSNYIRRLLPRHAVFENKTWEGAEIFTNSLSWELIDDYSNGMMLLEFNKMPKARNIDPSLKLFHFGLFKNGVMKKLAECDYEKKGEKSECMGLELSLIHI